MGFTFRLVPRKDDLSLAKTDSGEWLVKKNLKILYIGSKDKCENYLNRMRMV